MVTSSSPNNGGYELPELDTRTMLNVGQLASNVIPGGDVANAGIELALAGMDREDYIKQARETFGDDTRSLKAGSPAFKQYVKELGDLESERLTNLGVMLAGGVVAGLAVAPFLVLGGPLGILLNLGVAFAGGWAATQIKEQFWPSQDNMFLMFANTLQEKGQNRQMTPEIAFVALTASLPSEKLQKEIFRSLGVKNTRGLTRMLESDEGKERLREAMGEFDGMIRASLGAMSVTPSATVSEQLAKVINEGHMSGVDLLTPQRAGQMAIMLNLFETQQRQAAQAGQEQVAGNPNKHLPTKGAQAAVEGP